MNTVTKVLDDTEEPIGIASTERDITDRKRAEESLRDSEIRYRRLFETAQDGILILDAETGMIVDVNPFLIEMLGFSRETFLGKKIWELGFFKDTIANEDNFAELQQKEYIRYEDKPLKTADGRRIDVEFVSNVYLVNHQKVIQCNVRDITDRKRAEEALWKANEALEQRVRERTVELEATNKSLEKANHLTEAANRAKSEFLANMSHEIRTPMTAILGYADLMLDENVGRDTREHVAVIKRNGEYLLKVIGDILDLSKIEAGKLSIEPTRCSLVQVVAEVVSLMRPQAAAKLLKLKTELAQPLPETVLTDPLRLRQMLVNLMGNAIKFTDQGEVRLAVRLNADRGRLSLCFDVTDTGIGMNEEQIGKLFKPFSQVDNSSTRKFGGTGLGLCISKHLAEALGGSIEVRSTPGKGSTFSVTIDPGPLDGPHIIEDAQKSATEPPPTAQPADADKTVLHSRILLAEDGPDNQQLIAMLLRNADAHVRAVENGQLAVEVALAAREAGEPFNVILMDMQMPVLDGYEATRQLRKRGYTGTIVALTAHAMAEDCQKCLAAGCNDYLPKPFQHRALLKMVARHITAEKEGKPLPPDYAQSSDNPQEARSCPSESKL